MKLKSKKNSMMKSIFLLGMTIICFCIFYGCSDPQPKDQQNTQTQNKTIAMVFPVMVDAFSRFENEVEHTLSGQNIDVHSFSAEGQVSRFQTVINSALLKRPDILVLIGTQLTNTGLAPKYEKMLPKVISSCISDPSKVEHLVNIGIEPKRKRSVAILTDMPKQNAYDFGADLIQTILPKVQLIGILYNNSEINSKNTSAKMITALKDKGINMIEGIVTSEEDVEKIARSLILKGAQMLIIPHDKYVIKKAASVVKIGMEATGGAIPVFSLDGGTVRKDGAAFGVSVDYGYLGTITAETALQIFNGTLPEDMPLIQQETANAYFNMTSWNKVGLPNIPSEIRKSAVIYED